MSSPEAEPSCHWALFVKLIANELLLRLLSDEPECLARASLVCKDWHHVLNDPSFRRKYSKFHQVRPILGFLYNNSGYDGFNVYSSFAPTTTFSPQNTLYFNWHVLDSRHGLILFESMRDDHTFQSLIAWDPIKDVQWIFPFPSLNTRVHCWNATVLCALDGCDHVDCHGSPFLVVFVGTSNNELMSSCVTYASVYTSEVGAWSYSTTCEHLFTWVDKQPSVLLGNTIYFLCEGGTGIMEYDVVGQRLSWINAPFEYGDSESNFVLVTVEDVNLGLAGVQGSCIYMWTRIFDANAAVAWAQPRVIELHTLFPTRAVSDKTHVIGFVEAAGAILLKTNSELLMVNLKSHRVKKVSIKCCIDDAYDVLIPYMSFYTPHNQTERELTWEHEDMMLQKYPEFFQTEERKKEGETKCLFSVDLSLRLPSDDNLFRKWTKRSPGEQSLSILSLRNQKQPWPEGCQWDLHILCLSVSPWFTCCTWTCTFVGIVDADFTELLVS